MREDDLLRFQWIADPRLSPDGTRVAFTLVTVDTEADEYRTNLWLCDVPSDGAPPAPPRELTFGGRDSQPRWSPDGRTLLFQRYDPAEETTSVWRLDIATGAETRVVEDGYLPAWVGGG